MKQIVFINFVNVQDLNMDDIYNLLMTCFQHFTHMYILHGSFARCFFQDAKRKRVNHEDDLPGIYFIKNIHNNIKCYSMLINVNDFNFVYSNKYTHVDYKNLSVGKNFDFNALSKELSLNLRSFFRTNANKKKSIAVIDLDDTIINKNGDFILEPFDKYLATLKNTFDLVVLWSHGCQQHVNHVFSNTLNGYAKEFDMIMVRSSSVQISNKGKGFLLQLMNQAFGVIEFTYSVLIDDQAYNYKNDYDCFIHVPKCLSHKAYNKQMWNMLYKLKNTIDKRLNL
ncbi:38K protein [Penaeus vannamei nudivirus]|nr:38K protein [Penaeus vannamei nucleopolyhedrovirus]